jgi:hypothetical protein
MPVGWAQGSYLQSSLRLESVLGGRTLTGARARNEQEQKSPREPPVIPGTLPENS